MSNKGVGSGSLAPTAEDLAVVRGILMIQAFMSARERVLRELYGRQLKPSPLRDELTREIYLAWADHRTLRVTDYARMVRRYGVAASVSKEVRTMVSHGLVRLVERQSDRRSVDICPTRKLVTFYREKMPLLIEDAARLLCG